MNSQQQQWIWILPSAILIIIGVTKLMITKLYHIQPEEMTIKCALTSTGVVSGTSRRMMMHRLWFGRTFSPFSSTCTMGEAKEDRKQGINKALQGMNELWNCGQILFVLPRSTSRIRSISVVSSLTPSILAIVQIGTNWSLSIWDIK